MSQVGWNSFSKTEHDKASVPKNNTTPSNPISSYDHIMQLQRTMGNQAVMQLLRRAGKPTGSNSAFTSPVIQRMVTNEYDDDEEEQLIQDQMDNYDFEEDDEDDEDDVFEDQDNNNNSKQMPQIKIPITEDAKELSNVDELKRQASLQAEGINRMSVKEWLVNTAYNRLKDPEISFGSLAEDALMLEFLKKNKTLSKWVLEKIIQKMKKGSSKGTSETRKFYDTILQKALEAEGDIVAFFESGGLKYMTALHANKEEGGIGRQQGSGDEETFKKIYENEKEKIKKDQFNGKPVATLHNPDQVMGGHMNIVWSESEKAAIREYNQSQDEIYKLKTKLANPNVNYETDAPPAKPVAAPKKGQMSIMGFAKSTSGKLTKKGQADKELDEQRLVELEEGLVNKKAAFDQVMENHFGLSSTNTTLGKVNKDQVMNVFKQTLKYFESLDDPELADTIKMNVEYDTFGVRENTKSTDSRKNASLNSLGFTGSATKKKRKKRATKDEKRRKIMKNIVGKTSASITKFNSNSNNNSSYNPNKDEENSEDEAACSSSEEQEEFEDDFEDFEDEQEEDDQQDDNE